MYENKIFKNTKQMSITNEEYIKRNLQGFEGDTFLKAEIESLIKKFNVNTIIETGTFLGGTTKVFSEMCEKVHTIELTEKYFSLSKKHLAGIKNIVQYKGSSEKILPNILKLDCGSTLLFLDAHFFDFCPLIDELKVIAQAKITPVIVIHDFKVPNRHDLGYDSYNGQAFEYSWIEKAVKEIYGDKFKYHYNDKADGAKRGVIFIYPCS